MKYVYRWEGVLIVLLLIEFILFSLINSDFLNISNLLFSTNDFLFIAIAAIPMTFVIVTGGIDVSVGSIMGLTSILIGVLWMNGISILFAVIISLIISCLAGALNGFIIKNDRCRTTRRYTRHDVFIRRNCTRHFRRGRCFWV